MEYTGAQLLAYLVFLGVGIWGALKLLEELFIALIKTMKFIGALITAILPVVVLGFISNKLFNMTPFELTAQVIGTEAAIAAIAYSMYNKAGGGSGPDINE